MGLPGRLFGTGKTSVTPEELSMLALRSAIQLAEEDDNSLHNMIRKAGVAWRINVRYELELITWELYIQDLMVRKNFPEHGDQISRLLREDAADVFTGMITDAGADPPPEDKIVSLIDSRFAQYEPAVRRWFQSQGDPRVGGLSVGRAVSQNLSPEDEMSLPVATAVNTQLGIIVEHFDDMYANSYTVRDTG